jgi:GNAT superfamily N-acetyltransferase
MSAVRVITAADIPGAMRLKEAAGWNQTEQDWRNLMRLAPEGCFGVDVDGKLAATTTAVTFGRDLAWIGMVLTHPENRGQGLARKLMEHALRYLEGRAAWIKLDATDMGRPLYEKLGFREECKIERWSRPANTHNSAGLTPDGCAVPLSRSMKELDSAACGADRSEMLSILVQIESRATPTAYAMGRAGSKATYFGPCVARSGNEAAALLDEFLECHPGESIYWDLLPHNEEAAGIATERGFRPLRKLVRMAIPGASPFTRDDNLVYAIAGFEFG